MIPCRAQARVAAFSSWVSAVAFLLKEPQNPSKEYANYVDDHILHNQSEGVVGGISREEFSYREYQPAPDGGWESLEPGDRPKWWRPEGTVRPPSGAKIALAFRGDYHRYTTTGFAHLPGKACSDYWVSKDNIASSIVSPLIEAGAEVKVYFHTYSDVTCTEYDEMLLQELKPHKYEFEEFSPHSISKTHTYIQALNAVIQDGWADFALLLRFDVSYNAPITAWSLNWNDINVPFFEQKNENLNSDLLITIPRAYFSQFLAHLEKRGQWGMSQIEISTWPEIGSHVHAIDENVGQSTISSHSSFLGIVRDCSTAYDACMTKK